MGRERYYVDRGASGITISLSLPLLCFAGGGGARSNAAAAGGGAEDGGDGGGDDGGDGGDVDDLATVASPLNAVSEVVGPLFESEARLALSQVLREVCPWFASSSPITTRFEMTFGAEKRQADLFSYCAGDSLVPCSAAPEAGVYLVLPLPPDLKDPALPAAAIGDGLTFSPADSSRLGPHKYFVGEAYSGTDARRRGEKVCQLETEVEFLMRRFSDRSGLRISDATSVIGAAAVVFPVESGSQRSSQVGGVLQLVRDNAGPHLQRLARAGRLLLVLLSADQAPQTAAQRDTTVLLRQLRKAQNLQVRQAANQRRQADNQRRQADNQLRQLDSQLAKILERLERLPPLRGEGASDKAGAAEADVSVA